MGCPPGVSRAKGTVPFLRRPRSRGARPQKSGQSPCGLSERQLRLLYLGFLLAAAAACRSTAAWRNGTWAGNFTRFLHNPLDICAAFGHGMMAAVVLLAIYQLDPPRRRALWWVLACVALSGLAANGGKMLVARTRPLAFDFHHSMSVWTTFGRWLPATSVAQAFPPATRPRPPAWRWAWRRYILGGAGCSCCWRCWSAVSGSSAGPFPQRRALRGGGELPGRGLLPAAAELAVRRPVVRNRKRAVSRLSPFPPPRLSWAASIGAPVPLLPFSPQLARLSPF